VFVFVCTRVCQFCYVLKHFWGEVFPLCGGALCSISTSDAYVNTLLLALLRRKERYTSNKYVVRRRFSSGAERDIIGCVLFFRFCGVVDFERQKDESLVLVLFFFFFFFIGLDKDQNVVGFLLLLILLRNADDAFLENACEW